MKRVLVTGGRDYADYDRVCKELDILHRHFRISLLIHGAAFGADRLAAQWADEHGVRQIACPASWKQHGLAAGPIRNALMLRDHAPDLVLAFPGGKGTADMMRRTLAAGITLIQVGHTPAADPACLERE